MAQCPHDPVSAELAGKAAYAAVGRLQPRRWRRDRLLTVQTERLGGIARGFANRIGSGHPAEPFLRHNERSQLVGNPRMLGDERFEIRRPAAINLLEVLAQGGFDPWILRIGRRGWVVH
jgi:hypothetical protein